MKIDAKFKQLGKKSFEEVQIEVPETSVEILKNFSLEMIGNSDELWMFFIDSNGQDVVHSTIVKANYPENFILGLSAAIEKLRDYAKETIDGEGVARAA